MNDLLLPIKRGREGGDLRGSIVIVFESQWKNLFLYLVLCWLCYSARSESSPRLSFCRPDLVHNPSFFLKFWVCRSTGV
jgi:hypothetical protein